MMAWRQVTLLTTLALGRNDGMAPCDSTDHSNPGQWVGMMTWRQVTLLTTPTLVSC